MKRVEGGVKAEPFFTPSLVIDGGMLRWTRRERAEGKASEAIKIARCP